MTENSRLPTSAAPGIIHPDARPLPGGPLRWTAYIIGVVLLVVAIFAAPWAVLPLLIALIVLCPRWSGSGHHGRGVVE